MITETDARRLAEMEAPMACYLSVYIGAEYDQRWLDARIDTLRREFDGEDDRIENLDRSAEMIRTYLKRNPPEIGSAVFACWLEDFVEGFRLRGPVEPEAILARSPYILPLVNALDEYERYCVVYLDHGSAGIYLVAGRKIGREKAVHGDIKNHVKKGGFSQARYERRREKDILHYTREIADQIAKLADRRSFDRLIIVGDRQLIPELEKELPQPLQDEVAGTRAIEGGLDGEELRQAVEPLFTEAERKGEHELLETIREERFRSGRAAVGSDDVAKALQQGRVQELLIQRGTEAAGFRCDRCGQIGSGSPERCPECGNGEPVHLDLIEEMVETAERTGAHVELSDPMDRLASWGGVAALLRY